MAKVWGIDLGMANSGAFFGIDDDEPIEIICREGMEPRGKGLPSYVEFNRDGTVKHDGNIVYDYYCRGNDAPVIWGIKRLIIPQNSNKPDEGGK